MAETSENKPDVPARPAKKRRILWLTILLVPILLVILTGVMLLGSPHRWQVSPRVSMAEAAISLLIRIFRITSWRGYFSGVRR